jgi:hypothetical protein
MEGESVLAGEDLLFPCLDLGLLSGGKRSHDALDHGVDLICQSPVRIPLMAM